MNYCNYETTYLKFLFLRLCQHSDIVIFNTAEYDTFNDELNNLQIKIFKTSKNVTQKNNNYW